MSHSFLVEKAQNFRAYLSEMKPSETANALIAGFSDTMLLPTIMVHLVPHWKAGTLPGLVQQILDNLTAIPEGQREAVEKKVTRYLEMFCEVASQ